ncbi:nucleoside-diphosphate-sugar epimerase [Motilibacter peucedani]|uniref:Nucleoside-diphosphate-sugar epimerase n=1 Tax=Motilibacter peucedani TaxID=598650 RepID=A0A420XMP1_9ACTN|nr:NAD-dependent epimerase/dehydratase family protein [Motilibacter peucedani]RKS72532.1 nucleoside-diphosphate-sugar epimerase [Motilibacter peucedani]
MKPDPAASASTVSARRVTVGVTGAAGAVGSATVRRLAADPRVRKVVAIDASRDGAAPLEGVEGVVWRTADVHDPALASALGRLDALVHPSPDTGAALAAATVLTAAAASRVARVVLVTSAAVYGALPDNPVPLDEDGPLRAQPDAHEVRELLEVEALAERSRGTHPGLSVTVVRPAALVGPGVETSVAGHFSAPRLLVVRGTEPRWQFCHVDDLADALLLAALGAVEGVLTVGCEGSLSQEQVEELSGLRRIELPAALAFGTAERLHRLGVVPGPAADLSYVVHPWVVPSARLLAAGWSPAYDNATAFGLLLEELAGEGHRAIRRDATLGAAGAAVAVVGTAALVRRARKRRRG